jgi:hypothetical protein
MNWSGCHEARINYELKRRSSIKGYCESYVRLGTI